MYVMFTLALIINSTIYGASIWSIYSTLVRSCVISATLMADEAGGLSSPTRAYEKMVPERVRLHMAMTALQFCYAGQHIILSAAVDMGVSKLVFPVYRNLTALLLLVPLAYFLERYIYIFIYIYMHARTYSSYIAFVIFAKLITNFNLCMSMQERQTTTEYFPCSAVFSPGTYCMGTYVLN